MSSTFGDALTIAQKNLRIQQLEEQIDRVRGLHEPISCHDYGYTDYRSTVMLCTGCWLEDGGSWREWPCPTIKALDGEDS